RPEPMRPQRLRGDSGPHGVGFKTHQARNAPGLLFLQRELAKRFAVGNFRDAAIWGLPTRTKPAARHPRLGPRAATARKPRDRGLPITGNYANAGMTSLAKSSTERIASSWVMRPKAKSHT